ncbi:hypothetical protein RFI_21328 [Reticulomyxa filosa]|uniref:Uncharacterized protein n=1 Tax=Reticulomyxa filosa TaxID=46433 RepID=X6MQV1_RETFI|nr:hypothetical protein RFI_21328 [Reticulomyxa filosa]|eukprot:ETO16031.1 hypothetical protein RFI_21328 [Reticulomyxa filosa]
MFKFCNYVLSKQSNAKLLLKEINIAKYSKKKKIFNQAFTNLCIVIKMATTKKKDYQPLGERGGTKGYMSTKKKEKKNLNNKKKLQTSKHYKKKKMHKGEEEEEGKELLCFVNINSLIEFFIAN